METVADLILNQEDVIRKMELVYYLQKKTGIFFDKSVILKTEIAKAFLSSSNLKDIDRNLVLTASLLYACRKSKGAQTMQKIQSYAKESAMFLQELGFSESFCNTCQMHNRYGNISPRNKEGDILELAEQLGGMVLDRSDRQGYQIPKALTLLRKNLQGKRNQYLEIFEDFVWETECLHEKRGNRALNEKDIGLIGSAETGLRVLNKFDDDDIRGSLIYVQDWELRNGLMQKEEPKCIIGIDKVPGVLRKDK